MRWEFHPEALQEYREAAEYYAARDPALALRFVEAVEDAIRRIQERPSAWRVLEDDVRRFGAITAPVDLLHGANTFTAVKDSLLVWQRLWPEARTWRIEGAGHLPLEEMPAAVAAILFAAAAR